MALLDGLFPSAVLAAEATEEDFVGFLYPEEASFIGRAIPRRQREFAAGRSCARRLMKLMEVEAGPIPVGADRAPVWPEGIQGVISHSEDRCVVAVARTSEISMLGLDIEALGRFDRVMWEQVCTPAELAWLSTQPSASQPRLAALVFSAKECGYKAQFPQTRMFLDFQQGHVAIKADDGESGTFVVSYPDEVARGLPIPHPLGRWVLREGFVITAIATESSREGMSKR